MNSRERVLAALNHREPDRVPIDLGGTRQSGMAASTYHKLKRHLGLDTPTRMFDVYQMIAEIERPVMDRLGADCVELLPKVVAYGIRNEHWKRWTFPDGLEVEVPGGFDPVIEPDGAILLKDAEGTTIGKMPKGGCYLDRLLKYPGAAHADPETLDLPLLSAEDCDHYHAQAEAYWQNTDYALIARMGPPYELFWGLGTGDFQVWMMTLATEPGYVHTLYEKLTEAWLENLRRLHQAVGDRVHVLQFNDDLGTQDAPFISVGMFRELIMPYYKQGLDWIHQNTHWKVFMHNDGAIFDLIPSLLEMGIDVLNPVQTTAKGMDPVRLKEQFGDRLVFWGAACDCQGTLAFGTPEEVAREVEENLRVLAPGGGYVLASVHNIQAGVPPENVIALFDTALSAGRYDMRN
jgi:uroporphyrinogen decarboxylase